MLRVAVERDHLERLVKRPLGGLTELMWNAVDADASEISADLRHGDLGGVDGLVVRDNGSGITREQAERYFGRLGGSWKKTATTTDGGRSLHGQAGQGRWAAYGLGEVVRWTSVATQVTGELARLRITGRRGSLTEFEVGEPTPAEDGAATGTVVEVEQLNDGALRALERDDEVIGQLTATFALVLEHYAIDLRWRGQGLDPRQLQRRRHSRELVVDGVDGPVELVVIEWSTPQHSRGLHLCDASGTSLHETKAGIHAPGFDFTAYLRWDGFRDMVSELALADLGHEPVASLVSAAREAMRSYFGERAEERGSELVAAWKADDTYPYSAEPSTALERVERQMFDIVAVTAAAAVEDIDARSRRLSLRLMREALENSPSSLHEVLQEVLDLPAEHVEELRALLQTTTLSAIISATRRITDRLDFLVGLEQLVFDRELRGRVLERRHLHRILANETWVFREEYALTADDVSLRSALRDHIKLLGRADLAPEDVEAADVVDADDRRVIVDLMLSRVVEQRRDHREHIVIELKRPDVHIGMEQISQLTRYAHAVARDSRFARTDTRWEFWIVGDDVDESAELMVNQNNREPGVIIDTAEPRVVGRAVTWAQVLRDARHRLGFVKAALAYSTSDEAGAGYLRRVHDKYLPTAVPRGAADPGVDGERVGAFDGDDQHPGRDAVGA